MMMTTTSAGKPDRFARDYDMIVTRRRKLLGFGGLDELVLIGLWDDASGKRRCMELVRLGTASSVETALKLDLLHCPKMPQYVVAAQVL